MTVQEHLRGCDEHHTARQACNRRAGDAVPAHLSRDLAGAPAAVAIAVERAVETQEPAESRRAIADGPIETIDTSDVPLLPLAALAVLTVACLVVLWRLFSRRSRD